MFDFQEIHLKEFLKKEIYENLELVFQPIFSIEENKIVKYEVLSRFNSCESKDMSTLEMIKILEKLDLIYFLDFLILDNIKKYLTKNDIKLSVNISPQTILKDEFTSKVLSLGENLNNLELEIIERSQIDVLTLNSKILKLKEKNVKFVIDDFPIKNSNLNNILDYSLDGIKIDKCLLKKLKKESTYKNMIIFLKDLVNEITIEGVETAEDFNFVKNSGADFIQGYYIGFPIKESIFKNIVK